MNEAELRQRQSLPLEVKIIKSIDIINKCYEKYDGKIYLSKGGIDSAIVEWLVDQSLYGKDIKRVCVANVEPVENIRYNKELGNILISSKISKQDVIRDWGYPIVSKAVAQAISRYSRTKHQYVKDRRLNGYIGYNGKIVKEGMIPLKYQSLIYAPFEISDKCCDKIKKKPLSDWCKDNKIDVAITGEMASESRLRKQQYLKHGCIQHDKKKPKCTPIGFWTSQDIMKCIEKYNIEIPAIYGKVIKKNGVYEFTGEQRTGCEICAFGIMFDKDRFKRLKERRPNQYNHMLGGGEWIRKDLYRWVKFRPNSISIWSNLYWVPNEKGYGYELPLRYVEEVLNIELL